MKTTRRTFLGGLAATSLPASVVTAAEPLPPTIDAFLAKAEPSELVRYHAKALADAMAMMHPDHSWRSEVDHEHHFVLTVGDQKIRKSARVAKVYIDDGPLLADDVTGTTAFADWEAGR